MIALTRIDDRLIHGQVATQWVREVRANKIYIVDDETANDEFATMICKGLAPLGTEVFVLQEDKAAVVLKAVDEKQNVRALILVKSPGALIKMLDGGLELKKVIVGGMGKRADRKAFYRSISVSDEEIRQFQEILERGVDSQCQIVLSDSSIPVSKLIKK